MAGDPDEPDASFNSAWIKVRWAEQQFGELQAIAKRFIEEHNKAAGLSEDGERFMHTKQIHPFIPCHAGDIIFSARSALDCCWMGLKRANDASAGKGTLPRADTREELVGSLRKFSVESAFTGSDELVLNGVRPYRDGNEALWFGGKVDNWNKHNMIVLTAQKSHIHSVVLINPLRRVDISFNDFKVVGSPPEGGGIIGGVSLQVHPDHKPVMTSEIILVSRKPVDERPLIPFLAALLKETREAVELFTATFGTKG